MGLAAIPVHCRSRENRTLAPGAVSLEEELVGFEEFGRETVVRETQSTGHDGEETAVPTYVNEFWTSMQRRAHSLHEVSYRACFKPQLPQFFIERLTDKGDMVYDPFMGRGTTLLEAALLGRRPSGCDVNPLSKILLAPRLRPPALEDVTGRLRNIDITSCGEAPPDLLAFYHPRTLTQLTALRSYLLEREGRGTLDDVDRWIRMVAVNRLTGHSKGFFSVYTLPPNQAVSPASQLRINLKRHQKPEERDVPELITRKTRSLLSDVDHETRERLAAATSDTALLTQPSSSTPEIPSSSVTLVVTSPPFLDVVDYAGDNWLRCWFCGIDPKHVPLTVTPSLDKWQSVMTNTLVEMERVLKPGGHLAFEVGEIRGGTINLEESVIRCGADAGLSPRLVLINDQRFTKTSNCWGVANGKGGTNTNRIVLFRKT